MRSSVATHTLISAALACAVLAAPCLADDDLANHVRKPVATLSGLQEVPSVITRGLGKFSLVVEPDGSGIEWALSYFNLETPLTGAHIHVGQEGANGAIAVFLCDNTGNAPMGTPACDDSPATLTGRITGRDVVDASAQGIGEGDLAELIHAIRAGVGYVNVHTEAFPAGEIRGQIRMGPRFPRFPSVLRTPRGR